MSSRNRSPGRRATIADVAREAGVSQGTVSLALNGSQRISQETRQRVEECAHALNYQPNHAASSLRKQSTQTIALAVPEIGNPVYIEIAKTIQQSAKQHGYHLHLISTENQPQEEQHALETLTRRRVDGLILISLRGASGLQEALRTAPGPVVIIGRMAHPGGDNVTVDSASGADSAVQHLWDVGCQQVAFINGLSGTLPASERWRGVQQAHLRAQRPLLQDFVYQEDFSVDGGYRAAQALLARALHFDGLFCANDLMAIGAMRALRQHGLRIPEDVAVIGMDDIRDCQITTPTLSSVSLLAAERGRLAAELLFDRLQGHQDTPPRQLTVSPVLIPRESTQVARATGMVNA